jgi:FKBP-type peptidyl-prolyl cis-trans isomerase
MSSVLSCGFDAGLYGLIWVVLHVVVCLFCYISLHVTYAVNTMPIPWSAGDLGKPSSLPPTSFEPFTYPTLQPKGSSFSGDNKEYIRFVLGEGNMIPAVEEALRGMKVGVWSFWLLLLCCVKDAAFARMMIAWGSPFS